MKKSNFIEDFSSVSLFRKPVVYDFKPVRKTYVLVSLKSLDGTSYVSSECIEDHLLDSVPLDFDEVKLQNLVDKGVDSHSLDMIDTQRLGCDSAVDSLVNDISSNPSYFVEPSKS